MAQALIMTQTVGDVIQAHILEIRIVDVNRIKQIGDELTELVQKNPKIKLVINFDKVEYLSSAMLGKLVAVNKAVAEMKGALRLCGIKATIFEIFKITKLNKIFEIHDDVDQAMKSLQTGNIRR